MPPALSATLPSRNVPTPATATTAATAAAIEPAGRISPRAAFFLLASITVSFLAGSSAPTPLYPLYQAQWGFSSAAITVIFGIYAVALLAALLIGGRLSDHVGRRPVLIGAAAMQVAAMGLFIAADGLGDLIVARVVQGVSTGFAVAAVGAGMLDLDKLRGPLANAVAPPFGTALGGIAAGLMVHFLPQPTHLVYVVLALIFIAQGVGVALMAEPSPPQPGALASLRPRFSVPAATRQPLLIAIPVLIAAWSLAGFYAALGPTIVHGVLGLDSSLLGGIALFVLAASGGTAVLLLQRFDPRSMMAAGSTALLVGVGFTVLALSMHSTLGFFLGTAMAGTGFGTAFQGAIRTVVPFARPHERAGVLSIIFVVSYVAMGTPAVLAGWWVARHGDILGTAEFFGAAVMALAAIALAGTLLRMRRDARTVPAPGA